MENLSFSFQNVLNENGLVISLMGMLIVFFSLTMISLFITLLPKILLLFDQLKDLKKVKVDRVEQDIDPEDLTVDTELYAAICAVIALEIELSNFGDDQIITLKTGSDIQTAWATVGKMRTLSSRIAS